MLVLYDADCGFCRWAVAWGLCHDPRHVLVAVPIQSELGAQLLADLSPGERLAAAHVVRDDGTRDSGGTAVAEVLGALPSTRALGRLARVLPAPTAALYGLVARHRHGFGRFVGAAPRRRADRVLQDERVTTAGELERRTGRGPTPSARPRGRY
jgi:predicted DCC family thiol-disulfide oxidoreductase YuxK